MLLEWGHKFACTNIAQWSENCGELSLIIPLLMNSRTWDKHTHTYTPAPPQSGREPQNGTGDENNEDGRNMKHTMPVNQMICSVKWNSSGTTANSPVAPEPSSLLSLSLLISLAQPHPHPSPCYVQGGRASNMLSFVIRIILEPNTAGQHWMNIVYKNDKSMSHKRQRRTKIDGQQETSRATREIKMVLILSPRL